MSALVRAAVVRLLGTEMFAEYALKLFGALYAVEEAARELDADQRKRLRQLSSKPITDTLHDWLALHRQRATDGTAIARAIDYSLGRWAALVRFVDDGELPIDNNHIENRIRPIALGRSNWLFAGSLRGGQRAAAAMSLIQSAKLNGHDPCQYLRDILDRLPTQPARSGHSETSATRSTELSDHAIGRLLRMPGATKQKARRSGPVSALELSGLLATSCTDTD